MGISTAADSWLYLYYQKEPSTVSRGPLVKRICVLSLPAEIPPRNCQQTVIPSEKTEDFEENVCLPTYLRCWVIIARCDALFA